MWKTSLLFLLTCVGLWSPSATASGTESIFGLITDRDGHPIVNVRVNAFMYRQGASCYPFVEGRALAFTNRDGIFRLSVTERANYGSFYLVPPPGYCPLPNRYVREDGSCHVVKWSAYPEKGVATTAAWEAVQAEALESGWPAVRFILERSDSVAGRVIDPDGHSLVAAMVTATWTDPRHGERHLETETDGAGSFSLPVPAELGGLVLNVRPRGELAEEVAATTMFGVRSGTRDMVVALSPAYRLALRLVSRGEDEVWGGWLKVTPEDPANGPIREERFQSDDDPIAEITGLPAGRYRVVFRFCTPSLLHPRNTLDYETTVHVPGPQLQLELRYGKKLSGVVVGEDLEKFLVSWSGSGCSSQSGGTWYDLGSIRQKLLSESYGVDEDGRFEFDSLHDEVGSLYARRIGDSRCALLEGVRAGADAVRLELVEGERISGRIERFVESGLKWAGVRATQGAFTQLAWACRDGRFSVVGLPEGEWRLEVFSEIDSDLQLLGTVDAVPAGASDVVIPIETPR